MEKKYVVPDGMLQAAGEEFSKATGQYNPEVLAVYAPVMRRSVEAVLKYQAEHPPVPSNEQITELGCNMPDGAECNFPAMAYLLPQWMRIPYLAPEPEIPEAVRDAAKKLDVISTNDFNTLNELFKVALRAGRQG